MTASKLCGASVYRCSECANAVGGSRVRSGEGCPKHPTAEVVNGSCEKRVKAGALRCSIHGAFIPVAAAKAAEREVEAAAARLLEGQDVDPVTNPLVALAELLGEKKAFKDTMREKVDALRRLTVEDLAGRQDIAPLLAVYERSLVSLGNLLVAASRLNLDERIIQIQMGVEHQHAQIIADVLLGVIELAPPELQRVMRKVLADRLRAADGKTPMPPLPTDVPQFVLAPDVGSVPLASMLALPPSQPATPTQPVAATVTPGAQNGRLDPELEDEPVRHQPETPAAEQRSFLVTAAPPDDDSHYLVPVRHARNTPVGADPSGSYAAHLRQ